MLNVPDIVKSVIRNEYTVKNHRIKFLDMTDKADLTNKNLVYDSFSFTESVCSQDQFAFGLSEASSVQFETVDTADYTVGNILDQRIQVSLEYKLTPEQAAQVAAEVAEAEGPDAEGAQVSYYERTDVGGYWYPIPIGVFYVEESPRNHESMTHRQVTAYSRNERNFKIEFAGGQKKSKVSMPVDALIEAATIQFNENDLMTWTNVGSAEYNRSHWPFRMFTAKYNNQNAWTYALSTSPVGYYWARSEKVFPNDIVFLKAVYKKHDADSTIGPQMYSTCLSKMPSNNYIYEDDMSADTYSGFKKAYSSAAQSAAVHACNFQPMVTIRAHIYDAAIDGPVYEPYCYPIFLQPNKTIVIDPANIVFPTNTWAKTEVNYYMLNVLIPVKWYGKTSETNPDGVGTLKWERWNNKTGEVASSVDFTSVWSFETTQTRDDIENVKAYCRIVPKSNYTGIKTSFESTFEFSKTSLGKYYTYSNALSTDDILNGTAELNASFMKTERDGSVGLEPLNNENPIDLNDSATVDSAWWDEYDVYPIGKVHYKYKNEYDEEVTANYAFNSENKSVYDISDNWLLSNISSPRTLTTFSRSGFGSDKGALYKWGSESEGQSSIGTMDTGPRIIFNLDDTTDGSWVVRKNCIYGYVRTVTKTFQSSPGATGVEYSFDVWCLLGDGSVTNNTYVKYLLRTLFIPKLQYASFTPLEMSVSNLPYLEAGDAIRFTAKDGETVVNSYVLKQTISGSQKIVSQIECVDGQILSREEDYEDE